MNQYYQFKITLQDIDPPIWRQFIVNSEYTLEDMHKIIQTVMGWTNSHLHQFIYNGESYCDTDIVEDFGEPYEFIDYKDVRLSDIFQYENQNMVYEYDFGDGWEHLIVLEKILNEGEQFPKCLAGERSRPPEDCGGPPGYERLLEILNDPKHREYEETKVWVGDYFDPEGFDLKEVNEMLKDKDFGCLCF